jgi:hypothetical protein
MPHCRRAFGADGAPAPCSSREHGARSCCCRRSGGRRSAGERCTRRCCCRRGSGRRGARGGARRGWTGGHRQHPRRPDRDGSPIKLVSVGSSRVVLDVVVLLVCQSTCVLYRKSTDLSWEGDEPSAAVAEEEAAPPAEESAPAPQAEPEAPAAEATLPKASVIEGEYSAEAIVPPKE